MEQRRRTRHADRGRPGKPDIDVFVDNLPGNVYRRVRGRDGTYSFEYLSSGLFRQFGIDHERLLAEKAIRFDWVHPDDRARMISDLEISAATLGLLDHRVRIVGQDGRVHWARGIGRPSRRVDGSTVWDGIVIDVTREVQAEAALRLAKDEADRAHGLAAALVSHIARRLDAPVQQFGHILAELDRGASRASKFEALRTCQARLEAALAEIGRGGVDSVSPVDDFGPTLTPRQIEVRKLLVSGLSNKAIAQRLGITPGTAKLHVAAVLRTVGARSRRDLHSSG